MLPLPPIDDRVHLSDAFLILFYFCTLRGLIFANADREKFCVD